MFVPRQRDQQAARSNRRESLISVPVTSQWHAQDGAGQPARTASSGKLYLRIEPQPGCLNQSACLNQSSQIHPRRFIKTRGNLILHPRRRAISASISPYTRGERHLVGERCNVLSLSSTWRFLLVCVFWANGSFDKKRGRHDNLRFFFQSFLKKIKFAVS